jgi:hypothetical protein
MEAIIASIFEIIYLQARLSSPRIAGMLPYIAHLWLSPFLGVSEADELIDTQLPRTDRARAASRAEAKP